MIPLGSPDNTKLDLRKINQKAQSKRLIGLQSVETDLKFSPLTSVLLTDLSDVSLSRLGSDPLSKFDTQVAFVQNGPFFCEVDLNARHIVFSEKFVQAIEFSAAQASLVNILNALKRAFNSGAEDKADLLTAIKSAQTALHSLYMSRLTLHILGEAPAPNIAQLLPDRHKLFVHQQTALCLIFALLHEQAHLEFLHGTESESIQYELKGAFVELDLTGEQQEEFLADIWAVRQFEGPMRSSFLRAASFFFFNQWVIDYLTDLPDAEHPPAFNRIQTLMQTIPDLQASDATFFNIMTQGLNQQTQLRTALSEKDQPLRYAKFLKWCRSHLAYNDYESLVGSVCKTYEEMGLNDGPIAATD